MQIEIRKRIKDFDKPKWDFLLNILENPALLIGSLLFLLLVVCESFYKNRFPTEPNTTYIGGLFSLCGLVLLYGILRRAHRHKKHIRRQMEAFSEYYIILLRLA